MEDHVGAEGARGGEGTGLPGTGPDLPDLSCDRSERGWVTMAPAPGVESGDARQAAAGMIGRSEAIRAVWRTIAKAAPTWATVLVTGESGTGKEVVARAIHDLSAVRTGPFVAVNCSAISESLIESELFGHCRGAFTGAHQESAGFFEAASGGTLFLDEISEMPFASQAKLLRAIERREIVRVGETRPTPVNARVLAASNRELEEEVRAGRFRRDLWFRLRVVELALPPLRERPEDIPLLAEHFLSLCAQESEMAIRGLDAAAVHALMSYPWPGNVRELQNIVQRAVILGHASVLGIADLPAAIAGDVAPAPAGADLRHAVRSFEADYIRRALDECGGNREATARRLRVNPSTLYRKMADLQIVDRPCRPAGADAPPLRILPPSLPAAEAM